MKSDAKLVATDEYLDLTIYTFIQIVRGRKLYFSSLNQEPELTRHYFMTALQAFENKKKALRAQ